MTRLPVPFVERRSRLPQAGRIRSGEMTYNQKRKKWQPATLDAFRFTAPTRNDLDILASLYGGEVKAWSNPKSEDRFELYGQAPTIQVKLPPDPLGDGPTYEMWGGKGLVRSCDGITCEMTTHGPDGAEHVERPCLCRERRKKECKPKLRLSVILPQLPLRGSTRPSSTSSRIPAARSADPRREPCRRHAPSNRANRWLDMCPPDGIGALTSPIMLNWTLMSRVLATDDGNMASVDLGPVSVSVSPARRVPQLLGGLVLYGVSMALLIRSVLGLDPWDVFHDALSKRTGLSFGTITAITGALVLLCWLPLRQRPGVGTICNILLIAVAVDATLLLLPAPRLLIVRIALLIAGVVLNALATAAYIGARLGPGPRDGLMTGLHARTRVSIRLIRTLIEVTVLATGWLLGGTVGLGTVIYALAIGPLTQAFLPLVTWTRPAAR